MRDPDVLSWVVTILSSSSLGEGGLPSNPSYASFSVLIRLADAFASAGVAVERFDEHVTSSVRVCRLLPVGAALRSRWPATGHDRVPDHRSGAAGPDGPRRLRPECRPRPPRAAAGTRTGFRAHVSRPRTLPPIRTPPGGISKSLLWSKVGPSTTIGRTERRSRGFTAARSRADFRGPDQGAGESSWRW